MGKNAFVPPTPHVEPPSEEVLNKLEYMTAKERKRFKKSKAYKKYVKSFIDRENKQRRSARHEWWKNNWIALLGLLFAIIAAMPVIIQGIETILKWLL